MGMSQIGLNNFQSLSLQPLPIQLPFSDFLLLLKKKADLTLGILDFSGVSNFHLVCYFALIPSFLWFFQCSSAHQHI